MLSINGVYMLTNVVIANITRVDLVLRGTLFYGVDATIEAQPHKKGLPLSILHAFYRQRVSVALQHV